jgi:hypothetical protein
MSSIRREANAVFFREPPAAGAGLRRQPRLIAIRSRIAIIPPETLNKSLEIQGEFGFTNPGQSP